MNNATNIAATKDFIASQGIVSGMTQEHQVALMVYLLIENGLIVEDESAPAQVFGILYSLANASALRQKLEAAKVLTPTEGKRKGLDGEALASKYAGLFNTPKPATPTTPETPAS